MDIDAAIAAKEGQLKDIEHEIQLLFVKQSEVERDLSLLRKQQAHAREIVVLSDSDDDDNVPSTTSLPTRYTTAQLEDVLHTQDVGFTVVISPLVSLIHDQVRVPYIQMTLIVHIAPLAFTPLLFY
ncbi:hypothetical protein DYB26_015477 [Aphanomyces astaci]|uniref:Uncharacterized protein n=1 Tax=Aphanomyces astaci TaxID=112090 RepID=A0A3R6Y9T2_APHAT|nr:hypothetical protein DYB26_015477 [Aphanomyces astaci]